MNKFSKNILILSLLLCFILSGCSSDSKYTELEQRVAYLESLLGVNENSETPAYSEAYDSTNNNTITETGEIAEKDGDFLYYIDNMSAEEIVSECVYYFNNLPYKGEHFEEYLNTFKVTPILEDPLYPRIRYYYKADAIPEKDVLKEITIDGWLTQMDGSLTYVGESSWPYTTIGVYLWIKDYNKAADVYDRLYNYLLPYYSEDGLIEDHREGTSWYARGGFPLPNGTTFLEFMNMSKSNDYFVIYAHLNSYIED